MTEVHEWRLEIPGRPIKYNEVLRGNRHWTVNREATKLIRHAAATLARQAKIPPCEAITVFGQSLVRTRRSEDVGACFPAVKAAVDGLRDAGVVPDDDPRYVRLLAMLPPALGVGRDALEITVRRVR